MTAEVFFQLLNNGIPAEAIGGLTSSAILGLISKAKGYFKNQNNPTKQEYEELVVSNEEFKNTIAELTQQLKVSGYAINEAELIVIKNQLNNPNFENEVTFQ